MGFKDLLNGEELIAKQNSVIKDLPTKGLKEFSPSNSWIEKKQIEKKLEDKFNFISTERIEKSNNLSLAEWIPHLGKAKVLKKTGKLWDTIGHHKDNEDWLLPEEILFLVENCELQLILNNVCASVEDCYALLIQEDLCSFDEYRVYSYLCRAGLRVIRHSPSVTVTSYEQQVNLDTILQQCKRSPPSTSSINTDDNEVMIIDEINVLNYSSKKETNSASAIEKQNIGIGEIIEIEDDIEQQEIIEELLDSSNDSSDIVCISSPSYTSTEHYRLWYPTVNHCLIRSMEKVIDLCSDDSPNDYKKFIHNKLDLLKYTKAEVLSFLPSAVNGVTVIHSPDSRLLPSNIVPKYSEYKVNLNIRSDYRVPNHFKPYYNPIPRMPFTNMSNKSQMNAELMTNPLFQKAEEMQEMAMNMIQTASTLMSVISSQNPNELWNFIDKNEEMKFHSRFRDFHQQRPYYRFPRRNYRAIRRRNPYEKRGGGRYFRRSKELNNSYDPDFHSSSNLSPEVKLETVVLSDDDDTFSQKDSMLDEINSAKRKRMDSEITSKKVKTESAPVDGSLVLENSNFKEKKLLTKSDDSEISSIKEESHDLIDCIEINEVVYGTQAEIEKNITSESNGESRNLETNTILENNKIHTSVNAYDTDKINEQNDVQHSCNSVMEALDITNIDFCNKCKSETLSHTEDIVFAKSSKNSKEMVNRTESTLSDKITSWEEYKSTDGSQLGVEVELLEESESILQFENCRNYGDILNALQIFKEINLAKKKKKIKISYDIYLPGTSFKKTLKVLPNFRLIILKSSEELPTPMDLKSLKTDYQDQIPFLFTKLFNESVVFYLYDTISLPPIFE